MGELTIDTGLDPLMYHWSPSTRRKQIERYGFRPGMWSIDRTWRPPFVCFAPDPHLAWVLSGAIHPEIPQWDLWVTWESCLENGREVLFEAFKNEPGHYVKEYRVYERIYKRDVWYVATRSV